MPWALISVAAAFVAFGALARLFPCNRQQRAFVAKGFLDDFLYDPIREATRGKQIERLAKGLPPSVPLLRFLARLVVKRGSDATQRPPPERARKARSTRTRRSASRRSANA